MSRLRILISAAASMMLAFATSGAAEDGDAFFEKKIRPLLARHCYECHGEDADESGLRVDSLAGLLRGGERGPAIVAGKPDESLLLSAVRHGELLKMPPKRKLLASEVADLEQWVRQGASWPGERPTPLLAASPGHRNPLYSAAQLKHWAFQRPATVVVPSVPDFVQDPRWSPSALDAFIGRSLAERGLTPAPPAEKAVLVRRVTLDLIGLPPTPEEVDAFLADDSPDAWSRLVERLLAAPQYGERWGRHWLDVARYADSNGLDENLAFANAFRYRDYVVAAWNRDLPFDQFVREQLAGDLLPSSGDAEADLERIVATGFLSLGAKMLAEDDPVKMQMDILDEQVDTLGRVFWGMTLGCARCHDHKFDPFSTADYYGLAGIFASTKTMETHTVVARWLERPLAAPDVLAARAAQQAKIAEVDQQLRDKIDRETQRIVRLARQHLGDYLLSADRAEQAEALSVQQPSLGNDPIAVAPEGGIRIEAEDYARGNVLQDKSSYGVGIGVLVNRGETPNFAEYDVTIPKAGMYQLEVRYAAASSRPTKLLINGRLVKPNVAAEVTGGWQPEHQVWKVAGFFPLRAGPNVLRLEQPQFFPHIDKLLLFPAPRHVRELPLLSVDAGYEPLPEWVDAWRKYLRQSRQDLALPLRAWHELDANSPPASRLAVGERIQSDAARVVAAWESQVAKDKDAKSLPDASDEVLRGLLYDPAGPFAAPMGIEEGFAAEIKPQVQQLREEKSTLEAALPKLPEAMAATEDTPRDLRIHIRGSHLTLGPVVPRRFPPVFGGPTAAIDVAHSGRLEFANWAASREHPLTARVIVNRLWQWHFREGLVRSTDNFGLLGDRPTDPELLEWLTHEFVESGWSLKHLQRLILLSSTYRMSTHGQARAAELDPDNTRLWRFPRRRMEVETLRDALLAVSGQLDLQMRGSLLPTPNRQYVTSTANVDPVVYESRRRSLYLPVVRSALYDLFQAFDFPDPSVSQGRRDTTTIAPQALFLMNSKFASEQTRELAATLLADPSRDDPARVGELFRRAFGRPPGPGEVERSLEYVSEHMRRQAESQAPPTDARLRAWQSLCRAVISTNEFVHVE